MDVDKLQEKYSGKLCFWVTLDVEDLQKAHDPVFLDELPPKFKNCRVAADLSWEQPVACSKGSIWTVWLQFMNGYKGYKGCFVCHINSG